MVCRSRLLSTPAAPFGTKVFGIVKGGLDPTDMASRWSATLNGKARDMLKFHQARTPLVDPSSGEARPAAMLAERFAVDIGGRFRPACRIPLITMAPPCCRPSAPVVMCGWALGSTVY